MIKRFAKAPAESLKPKVLSMPVGMCLEHGKPRDLICVPCKIKCCDTCALFGSHKGHDVRQRTETLNEIKMRTEVLIEMYEQLDQTSNSLSNMDGLYEHLEFKL